MLLSAGAFVAALLACLAARRAAEAMRAQTAVDALATCAIVLRQFEWAATHRHLPSARQTTEDSRSALRRTAARWRPYLRSSVLADLLEARASLSHASDMLDKLGEREPDELQWERLSRYALKARNALDDAIGGAQAGRDGASMEAR